MLASVNGAAVFVKLILPDVIFVAVKLLIVFAPPSTVPPAELVTTVPVTTPLD
jgi:hypothetical protein